MPDRPVDKEALYELVDEDSEFLEMLIETFLDDCASYMEAIRTAVEEDDPVRLMEEAHGLKGAVANLYASSAQEAARRLEEIGRSGDFENADAALADLEREIEQVKTALAEMLEEV